MNRRGAHPSILLFTDNKTLASWVERQLGVRAAITRVSTRSELETALRADESRTVLLDPLSGQDHVDVVPHRLALISSAPEPTTDVYAGGEPLTGLGALALLHELRAADRTMAVFGFDRFRRGEQVYAAACAWILGTHRVLHPKRQGVDLSRLVLDSPVAAVTPAGDFARALETVSVHMDLLLDELDRVFAKPQKAKRKWSLRPWRSAGKHQETPPKTGGTQTDLRALLDAIERSRGNTRALAQYTQRGYDDLLTVEEKLRSHINDIEAVNNRSVPTDGTALFNFVTDRIEVFLDSAFTEVWEIHRAQRGRVPSPRGAAEAPLSRDQEQAQGDEEDGDQHAGDDDQTPTDRPWS